MNFKKSIFLFILFLSTWPAIAQESDDDDYIIFNDRHNVVHGFYLGISGNYGELNGISAYGASLKMAYVANQQFEAGISLSLFQSDQQLITSDDIDNELVGGILGFHLEPIFFSKERVSLSFPVLVGAGLVGYVTKGDEDFDDDFIDAEYDDVGNIFAIEPGVNVLFNISRYFQLEAGVKYRFTSDINLATSPIKNLNGLSGGLGIKVGVFNLGRNRYKKKLP